MIFKNILITHFTILICLAICSSSIITSSNINLDQNNFSENISSVLKTKITSMDNNTWNFDMIYSEQAKQLTEGNNDTIVAVLDSGIDYNYDFLKNSIWSNDDPMNGLDDDSNGYIDDFMGWDFYNNDRNPNDDLGHGTFISSIITGFSDSEEIFIPGIAPNIKIMPLKVLNDQNYICDPFSFANAIIYAVNNGADVISMSIWTSVPPSYVFDAINYAYDNGVLLIGITGNYAEDYPNYVSYMGKHSRIIAVGAVTPEKERTIFSQWGSETEIMAPGDFLYGLTLQNSGSIASLQVIDENFQAIHVINSEYSVIANKQLIYAHDGELTDYSTINATEKVVLIDKGDLTYDDQFNNAVSAGAVGIIIANDQKSNFKIALSSNSLIPGITISNQDGTNLKENLSYNDTVLVNIETKCSNITLGRGTSYAAPHVSGVAALMFSINPSLTNIEARKILQRTATDLNETGKDIYTGYGLVNAFKAVKSAADTDIPQYSYDYEDIGTEIKFKINSTDDTGIYKFNIDIYPNNEPEEVITYSKSFQGGIMYLEESFEFPNNVSSITFSANIEDLSGNIVQIDEVEIIFDTKSSSGFLISSMIYTITIITVFLKLKSRKKLP